MPVYIFKTKNGMFTSNQNKAIPLIQAGIKDFNLKFKSNKVYESPYGWAFAKLTKKSNGELTNKANVTLNNIANLNIIELAPKVPNQPRSKKPRIY
jgi:hypothetical protein